MYKLTVLGSGAAPGVPSVAGGWGNCRPDNPKNRRSRTGVCVEYDNTRVLIDTSPDLRLQLLTSGIRHLDGILYTHAHADHLHGIDELREINRAELSSLNFYASEETTAVIKERFSYLLADRERANNVAARPSLVANVVEPYQPFVVGRLKITPIRLLGHNMPTTGYLFNDGEIVYIADYRQIDEEAFEHIRRPTKLMIVPLTTPEGGKYHASLAEILDDIARVRPERALINQMAIECDYDAVNRATPAHVEPAYDGMSIHF